MSSCCQNDEVFKSFIYFGYTLKHNFWKIHIYSDLMPMCLCANWCKALKVATGHPEIQVLVIVVIKSNIIIKLQGAWTRPKLWITRRRTAKSCPKLFISALYLVYTLNKYHVNHNGGENGNNDDELQSMKVTIDDDNVGVNDIECSFLQATNLPLFHQFELHFW